jgi:predicted ester cyclase
MEQTEKNKALVRRAIEEVYNQNSLVVVDEIYAPNYVLHHTFGPEVHGPEGVKELANMRRAVFANDVTITIEDQIAEADKVVTRWTVRGAHQGETAESPPNSDQGIATGMLIDRIARDSDKIEESWAEEHRHLMGVPLFN